MVQALEAKLASLRRFKINITRKNSNNLSIVIKTNAEKGVLLLNSDPPINTVFGCFNNKLIEI